MTRTHIICTANTARLDAQVDAITATITANTDHSVTYDDAMDTIDTIRRKDKDGKSINGNPHLVSTHNPPHDGGAIKPAAQFIDQIGLDAGDGTAWIHTADRIIIDDDTDLTRTRYLLANDCDVHICDPGLRLTAGNIDTDTLRSILFGAASDFEIPKIGPVPQAEEDNDRGRPPLGFRRMAGELRPTEDYQRISRTLQLAANGEISKASAADELDCSRRTIYNALNKRPHLYQIDCLD